MTRPACLLKTDLSSLRLVAEGETSLWTAPAADAAAEPVETLRTRAAAAADWLAAQTAGRRRLSLACLDVDDTACAWLRAPSAEPAVLAATLRSAGQDWGERFVSGGLQPLTDPAPAEAAAGSLLRRRVGKRAPRQAPAAIAVLSSPDALPRLWLDRLDVQGITFDAVTSLWHAMASAWGAPASGTPSDGAITATLLLEAPERAVWSWSRGPDLLAGGQAMMDRPAPETAQDPAAPTGSAASEPDADPMARLAARLALDWLTWSAQLGLFPARAVLVGAEARPLAAALVQRWPALRTEVIDDRDPLTATVRRAAAAMGPDGSSIAANPRRAYANLSHRPTRALRAQYLWAGAALLLLSAALTILGLRFGRAAEAMRAENEALRERAAEVVAQLQDPTLARAGNLEKALDSRLAELKKRPPVQFPPVPRPLHDEFNRTVSVLAKFEGVRILQFNLDARSSGLLQITVPSRRTGEEILQALQASGEAISWSLAGAGASTDQQLRLNANWIR